MKVLFLMGIYPAYGGVEKVSTILANEFVSRGHEVGILSFEQPVPELAEKELNRKIALYAFKKPVLTRRNIRKLRQLVVGNGFDIIINQWCVPWYVARLCKKAIRGTSCKLVSVHHNRPNTNARIEAAQLETSRHPKSLACRLKLSAIILVSRLSLRYTYLTSDAYVVLSPSFKRVACQYMWLRKASKLRVVANPITIPPASGDDGKENEILYVGRIEYNQKRTFRLVDMWEQLYGKFPQWKMAIVGDGPDRDDLQQRIEKKGLPRITIEGFQNPLAYYRRAAILLLTSEYEGFPLVITEGMNYGVVPVVLGSFEAVFDIIDDGRSGFIAPYPYSQKAFMGIVETLVTDNRLRVEMAKEAKRSAEERFSLAKVAGAWEMLFKELCHGTGSV